MVLPRIEFQNSNGFTKGFLKRRTIVDQRVDIRISFKGNQCFQKESNDGGNNIQKESNDGGNNI